MIRRSTLRQLQIFAAVARHESFTRAAEELFLTQSSVSTQIKQLKDLVGHPLIEQIGKKITITPVGQRTLELYNRLDEHWREYEDEIGQLTNPEQGEISVSGVKTCQYFLPRVLGSFSKLYPDIRISLKVLNREQVIERINKNMDDFYIMGLIPDELEMKVVRFIDNPLLIIATPDHPLASKKDLPVKALENERFIVREPGSGTRIETNLFFEQHKLHINSQIELGSNEAIKQGVIGGAGISLISLYGVALELRLGLLTTLDVKGFPLVRPWNIAYPAGKVIKPATRTFIDYLKLEGRSIANNTLDHTHLNNTVNQVKDYIEEQ